MRYMICTSIVNCKKLKSIASGNAFTSAEKVNYTRTILNCSITSGHVMSPDRIGEVNMEFPELQYCFRNCEVYMEFSELQESPQEMSNFLVQEMRSVHGVPELQYYFRKVAFPTTILIAENVPLLPVHACTNIIVPTLVCCTLQEPQLLPLAHYHYHS